VYHIELRQFPHNACRFNLGERELQTVVEPWARGEWIEFEERKWSPHQAKLTILAGPRMPVQQLTMGRGWRNAERHSEDVTERVLAAAKAHGDTSASHGYASETLPRASPGLALLADSLGLEILSLLEGAPLAPWHVWQLAQARLPERPASDSLALAELALKSLAQRRLIVLLQVDASASQSGARKGSDEEQRPGEVGPQELGPQELESVLRALDSWSPQSDRHGVRLRRA
jgi:hypothetical protein